MSKLKTLLCKELPSIGNQKKNSYAPNNKAKKWLIRNNVMNFTFNTNNKASDN